MMKMYGLIGEKLTHSFSQKHFTQKFNDNGLSDCRYDLYELPEIGLFHHLLRKQDSWAGFNVTIPYKESIIPFLDEMDEKAARIGAVNVIAFTADGKRKGYNSDYWGFKNSLVAFLPQGCTGHGKRALVLGTGGASKAVCAVLEDLGWGYDLVSRTPGIGELSYDHLTEEVMRRHELVVNTTPLGTFPDVDTAPRIPYEHLGPMHYCHDLVYNPAETAFMKYARAHGAHVKNGMDMLIGQAEKAWEIWNAQS
jgi:shikimate dehydrogenase